MGANLEITEKLKNYINDFGLKLDPVQKEIIEYNNSLGDIKRMQIDPSQCYFLHLIRSKTSSPSQQYNSR